MKVKTMLGVVVLALMLPVTASATPYFGTMVDGVAADLWTFSIGAGGANFSANTLGSPITASGYQLDTQLWIFDSNWQGIVGNDNALGNGIDLWAQITPRFLSAGTYFLAVSLVPDVPAGPLGQALFQSGLVGQLAPVSSAPLAGWMPDWAQAYPYNGPYVLNLEGVESAAPVPEPASMTLFGTGLAVLYRTYRKRQKA